jgi:hypothetical protein
MIKLLKILDTIAKRDEVSLSQTAGRAIAVSGSTNQRENGGGNIVTEASARCREWVQH